MFFVPFLKINQGIKSRKNFTKKPFKMSCEVEKLANFIAGHWTNKEQATKFPSDWSHFQVGFYPLEYSFLDGFSFFTESANEYSLDAPYRTGVLLLEPKDNVILAKTFSIVGPEDFWYASYEPSLLKSLTKDRLIEPKDGCVIEFKYDKRKGIFLGKTTQGKKCIIPRDGITTYLDSTFSFGENKYTSLDTGRNIENDEQVWGSKAGPFVFLKMNSFPLRK